MAALQRDFYIDVPQDNSIENDISSLPSCTVLITGFGPFSGHQINASWEAVSNLPDQIPNTNIKIIKEQIEVSYDYVDNIVPMLWSKYKPDIVIHVGVSGAEDFIQIETNACRNNYQRFDINKKLPLNYKCLAFNEKYNLETNEINSCNNDEYKINSCINIKNIIENFNNNKINFNKILSININNVIIKESHDAGRYLCEYTYYTSLCMDKNKCIFIHVPCIDLPYTLEELTQSLLCVIYILATSS